MLNDRLVLVGVAALSAVATAGWMRQTPVAVAPQVLNFAAPMLEPEPVIPVQSAAFNMPMAPTSRESRRIPAIRASGSAYDRCAACVREL